MRWLRYLAILVAVLAGQNPSAEPPPKAGLLWQNTGLPAVFPLIVKTKPGRDYYFRLHAIESGEAKLAAYAKGGAFFKVLVPPGTYELRVATGTGWQGETNLFGKETRWIILAEPLIFEIKDFSTKSGQMVDLRQQEEAPVVEARYICHGQRIVSFPRPLPPFEDDLKFGARLTEPGVLLRYPGSYFDPSRLGNSERPIIPTEFAPYFSTPDYKVRARLC